MVRNPGVASRTSTSELIDVATSLTFPFLTSGSRTGFQGRNDQTTNGGHLDARGATNDINPVVSSGWIGCVPSLAFYRPRSNSIARRNAWAITACPSMLG